MALPQELPPGCRTICLGRATMLLRRAGVTFTRGQVPDANKIRAREDEKLVEHEETGESDEQGAGGVAFDVGGV